MPGRRTHTGEQVPGNVQIRIVPCTRVRRVAGTGNWHPDAILSVHRHLTGIPLGNMLKWKPLNSGQNCRDSMRNSVYVKQLKTRKIQKSCELHAMNHWQRSSTWRYRRICIMAWNFMSSLNLENAISNGISREKKILSGFWRNLGSSFWTLSFSHQSHQSFSFECFSHSKFPQLRLR